MSVSELVGGNAAPQQSTPTSSNASASNMSTTEASIQSVPYTKRRRVGIGSAPATAQPVSSQEDDVADPLSVTLVEPPHRQLQGGASPADLDVSFAAVQVPRDVVELREQSRGKLTSLNDRAAASQSHGNPRS